jgi:hypothetical protein
MEGFMLNNTDKISDILNVLSLMRDKHRKGPNSSNTAFLRIEAIKQLADEEFHKGRYKNSRSAEYTLLDACIRRLAPDINGVQSFDWHAGQWLNQNSVSLRDILMRRSSYRWQEQLVYQFFGEN